MSEKFSVLHELSSGNARVELDLSNYATNASLKGATGVDTSTLVSKLDLACLKAKVDNLHVEAKDCS